MFNALVLTHFTYCSNVWSHDSCSHIEKLKKLQKRAACVITGSTYEILSTEILNENWYGKGLKLFLNLNC